jgi:transposase InsO family protein
MSIVGQLLTRRFSPFRKICEVPLLDIQSALIGVFHRWGVPRWIKVDNGRPFGDPQRQIVPPLALWLISLGIRVIFNRPRIPQDNAKVERSQGVMSKWTEWQKCHDAFELQCRLWEEADFHNIYYPVRRLGNQTRIQAFPSILQSPRPFNPKNNDMRGVLEFIAQGHWERTVSKNGQIRLWGQRLQLGQQFAYQQVSIKLDPTINRWLVFDLACNLIKTYDTAFTTKNLWRLDLS